MPTPDDNFVSEVFAQFADHPGTPTDEDLIGQWPELRTRPELLAAVRERFRVVHDLERRLFGGLSVRRPVSSPPEPLRGLAEAHGYAIERELGRGGMGVVYLARRRQDGRPVALKTMQGAGGAALDRFKREFRQLATLRHPNLVELYELVSDGGQWFSVMEYVAGGHFLAHVRLPLAAASCATTEDYVETSEEVEFFPGAPQVPGPLVFDEARLRDGLRQLAEGVAALHAAGKLHLDVKPSNVLVGGDGRVKLADFGLVAELGPEGSLTLPGGTPHYMAPEQCPGAGGRVSAASDWYGVGSLLFEALTGRVPFEGPPGRVMADKQRAEPPSPAALVPGLPADLCLLCADLLRRDPSARPDGREVLRRLGVVAARPRPRRKRPRW